MVTRTREDCEAMLLKSGFVKFVDGKKKSHADNFVSQDGMMGVSWNPMVADIIDRKLTPDEERRGLAYTKGKDGTMYDSSSKYPPALAAYVAWADKDEQGPAQTSQEPSKNQEKPAPVANPETSTAMVPANQTGTLSVNNKPAVVKVNGIEIPNQYLVFYGRKLPSGKIDMVPYIQGEGLEYLVAKIGLWKDPRASDPTVMTKDLVPAIDVEPVKLPGEENAWGGKGEAVFKATVRMEDGQVYTNYGTATAANLKGGQAKYPIEMAIRRAKNRAIRTATNCNICSLEELELDQKNVIDADFVIVQ